ncbi:MAG: hypothetical protein IAA81_03065 [Spirochaetes bacterium]|uniref:Uncharacterized protein n=1 Tax=Candidatus Gallitreponema excrementavium TaxID=2840840 RepID=A0A9D9HNY4_9SPIR|nr:hypothetical protein [Candidatus Gallitreponema excrementavium]
MAQGVCTKQGGFGAKTLVVMTGFVPQSSVPQKNRQTIAKSYAFCSFCAFAKKNAVSLTNQGCKGCQNEALCRLKVLIFNAY